MIFWRYALFLPKDFPKAFLKALLKGARFVAKTDLLTGDVRVLTLKIAAPSVAAMLAASVCPLLEALVLSVRDASLSAAVGASLALILLEQTVGFTLGMGAGSSVSRCIGAADGARPPAAPRPSAFFAALAAFLRCFRSAGLFFAAPALLRLLGAPESGRRRRSALRALPSSPARAAAVRRAGAEQPAARAGERRLPNMAAALVGSASGRGAAAAIFCVPHGAGRITARAWPCWRGRPPTLRHSARLSTLSGRRR